MTDNEIIKALEGNILNAKSVDCKVWSIELYKIENALDLINRQKAEIERLSELEQGCYVTGYKNIRADSVKEFVEKQKKNLLSGLEQIVL